MIFARTTRASLLLSAAGFGLCAIATPALANDGTAAGPRIDSAGSSLDAHSSRPDAAIDVAHAPGAPLTNGGFVSPDEAEETPQITINNNFTPVQAYDPTNITGIGQMVTDAGGGSVGLCTGTLINPRTVIFAAHCVNTRAATAYGANTGGVGIGVGFETNTRANAAGQTDELVRWLFGTGATQAGRFQSNTAQHFYNINQVFYDPRSRNAASCTSPTSCFLEADVATAVLDTPAAGVPTWALLFSPLPTPGSIDPATGTGYHVNIAGYGSFGTGTTGAASSGNFRRRAAENMLGALVSINTRNEFLFGTAGSPSRPQQLYFLDFDDPARGTATANPRDFNGFRDNALPREGLTGPGDSGGPLILDRHFSKQVVIGVLSGGSTFFTGQPGGSYGTQSFYQPLFLYWDWIVANNPYRYVTALAGNRNWEDGTAWVTEIDPNYQIISGGQLVNGVPTHTGAANSGNGPQFGELCFQSPSTSANPAVNECENIATGAPRNNVPNGPADASAPAIADVTGSYGLTMGLETAAADPGYTDTVRPAPTIANGLPGATNFVPNNVDGVRTTGQIGRYYDVTLRNTGVITLNSAVVVDRFSIAGATSQLNIASGARLTSLMEIQQLTGTIQNNGQLTSVGDYLLLSGLLTGSGTVTAPFTTSVMGSIAPGTIGTTGTLTFHGGLVLSSGSGYLVDLGANGVSDRIVLGSGGIANIGGNLQISFSAATLRGGNSYTILSAPAGVTGTFNAPAAFSAILRPTLTYSSSAVTLNVVAGSYASVVPASNPVGFAWARILDANRGQAANYDALYGPLDLQNAATIISTLSGWAPAAETTARTLGIASTDSTSTFIRNRLAGLDPANLGGSMAYYGSPVQVAAVGLSPMGANPVRADMPPPMVQEGALPETMSGFISGGYLKGDGAAMTGMGGRDNYDGWYVGAGLEVAIDDTGLVGFAFTYTDTDGTASFGAQTARGEAFQGTLYAKQRFGGATIDGQVTAGALGTTTQRTAAFLGTNYTLRAKDSAMVVGGEVGLGFDAGTDAIEIAPRVAARGTWIDFGSAQESGGPMALDINRADYNSLQGRAGLTVAGKSDGLRPFVTATYVHEFKNRSPIVGATLIGGINGDVAFALNGQDKDWGEVSGGITFRTGSVDLSLSADTTIARSDLSAQSYRGSITFRF
ncbi:MULTISPECIES: autotransporter domain-containing protein [unclassified Sphingomonas]|uniref:autotransporter domain-containing protein n=1 Tax=unclassified Sphingomonas TaxID=196159 RepID=UPI002150993C|nr:MULTISPECIES: autotransporter domain-containing protein [unclassified Sphingomonas]MCR5870098.1 autotransporter domain-containing protein [Sphingomonas sp. J344]UUX98213.1 autotransporter domain-containing protein [Sphingomonas sp. J315]